MLVRSAGPEVKAERNNIRLHFVNRGKVEVMLNMIVNPQKLLQISNILNSNVRISHVK
jgi:hypothetical protein